MTYRSAAGGYKGGGFNLDRVQSRSGLSSGVTVILPVNDTSFGGEFVDSYELGAKTTWADGSLLLNATLFHQTYEDFQLNSFLGTSFRSEEHTSELQSLMRISYAVFCLQKKKNPRQNKTKAHATKPECQTYKHT